MNLNIEEWKPFRVGAIFRMLNGKGITQEEIADNPGNLNAVQSGEENNGVMGKIDIEYCRQAKYTFTEQPCLTVARSGSAGFVSFQADGCVVGDSAKILLLPVDIASNEIYLFLQSVLTANRIKYTYGRKVTEEKYLNDWIKLPVQHSSDGSLLLDREHRFSDDELIPDWQFMEDYIKSLHHKPLTTKNKSGQAPDLNVQDWKEFSLYDYFDVIPGKYHYPEEYEEGTTPYYSASNENNGIGSYIDLEADFEGNKVVTGKVGCTAFYAPEAFCATSDVNIFCPRFKMSPYVGLFVATVVNYSENYKWAYGRQCRVGNSKRIKIKLPVDTNGNPDWQFMEDYIKALPYGDRVES